jgi:Protein of unknown function (DUF2637)
MMSPEHDSPAMPAPRRDWWVAAGMTVSAAAAAVSSFSGLRSLAFATGWGDWLSTLLPLTIDAYAMTATRVWLADSTGSARARRFARWNAVGAVVLSVVGNATWHLIAAGLLHVTWVIVVVVGAVPAAVLGLLSHLAVLRTHDAVPEPVPAVVPSTDEQDEARTQYGTVDELLAAARAADAAYRDEHSGKPITRDALRVALRIGGRRASDVLRQLRATPQPKS